MTRFLFIQEPWLIVLLPYSRWEDGKSTAETIIFISIYDPSHKSTQAGLHVMRRLLPYCRSSVQDPLMSDSVIYHSPRRSWRVVWQRSLANRAVRHRAGFRDNPHSSFPWCQRHNPCRLALLRRVSISAGVRVQRSGNRNQESQNSHL